MSGHSHKKKDGSRKEKQTRARRQAFEQPVLGAVSPARGQDTSNFTDGDVAGRDWKHEESGQVRRHSPVSEPRRGHYYRRGGPIDKVGVEE